MSPRIAIKVCPTRRNVELLKQWVPNAPEVKTQGDVNNVEFCEAIGMLNQVVTYHAGKQRVNR